MTKVAFIINPIAGKGKSVKNIQHLSKEIFSNGEDYDICFFETEKAGHATDISKNLATNGYDIIVAVGGDGTVNEVAQGIINSSATMGIIPCGSGNGLARHLHIPLNPSSAIKVIAKQKTKKIDYALINGKPFFCTAGIGFDALIANLFAQGNHNRGIGNYIKIILSAFCNYKPEQYTLSFNEQTIERNAFLITFANASQWGNNGYIAPKASITDGLIDVAIVAKFPKIAIPRIVIQLFSKRLNKSKFVQYFRCEQITVTRKGSAQAIYAHRDGDPEIFEQKIDINIQKHGLSVIYASNHD